MSEKNKHAHTEFALNIGADDLILPDEKTLSSLRQVSSIGDDEAFQTELEEISYQTIISNPSIADKYKKNTATVRQKQASKHDMDMAVQDNRNTLRQMGRIILHKAGIEVEADAYLDEFAESKKRIQDIINQGMLDDPENKNVLSLLGILTLSDDGKERFTYPKQLFPESTDEKWQNYRKAVVRHLDEADQLRRNQSSSKRSLMAADSARKMTHDSISRDIQNILGFEESEDGFFEARRLVAKMRDSSFPNQETGEKERYVTTLMSSGERSGSVINLLKNAPDLYDPESAVNARSSEKTNHD